MQTLVWQGIIDSNKDHFYSILN